MNKILTIIIAFLISCIFFYGCNSKEVKNDKLVIEEVNKLNRLEFQHLMSKVANGWNDGDAQASADCFSKDAVYIEPPNQQLYQGRSELYEFFGGSEGRTNPMKMTWHYLIFDEEKQIGTGEYTFSYKGRLSHGIVIVQISKGKIRRWREYQYRSETEWIDFIGKSIF